MQGDPLEGIDQVEWAEVDHAYGEATDVPGYLRDLRSSDSDTREAALWSLYGNIYHQGSRYTATPLAIPFLYKLIDRLDTPDRGELLQFMASLAFGINSDELPLGTDIGEDRKRVAELRQDPNRVEIIKKGLDDFLAGPGDREKNEYLESYIKSLRTAGIPEDEAGWWTPEVRSYNAVQDGLDTAYRCLNDDSSEVRSGAAYLLAWFPDEFRRSEQHLMELLSREENPGVQATAIVSLATLQSMKGDFSETRVVRRLREINLQSGSCLVTWASSLSLIKLRANTDEQVFEITKTFTGDEEYIGRMKQELREKEFPFLDGRASYLGTVAVREMGHFKGSDYPHIVKALASHLESGGSFGLDLVTRSSALLNMAFDGVKPDSEPDFDNLNDLQQSVMRALSTKLIPHHRFVNFEMVLESWHLPRCVEDFQVFIKHPDAFQSKL